MKYIKDLWNYYFSRGVCYVNLFLYFSLPIWCHSSRFGRVTLFFYPFKLVSSVEEVFTLKKRLEQKVFPFVPASKPLQLAYEIVSYNNGLFCGCSSVIV